MVFGAMSLLFFPCITHAELIRNFSVDVIIDSDRTVHVTETIDDDTGGEMRSGFIRLLPKSTGFNGVVHSRQVVIEGVTRNGASVPFQVTEVDGYLRLSVNTDDEVSGLQRYVISYSADRAIDRVNGHDLLNWEVIGMSWDVPIEHVTFRAIFPDGSSVERIESACAVGIESMVSPDCQQTVSQSDVTLSMRRVLLPEEGLRVMMDIPGGILSEPRWSTRAWFAVQDHAPFVFPISAFIVMLLAWWLKGRDPTHGPVPIVVEPPENLPPRVLVAMLNEDMQPEFATEIYEKMFDADPVLTRGAFTLMGLIVMVALYVLFGSSGVGVVSAVATGLIIMIFGIAMPRRTVEGTKMLVQILGLKKFLSLSREERERLNLKQSPKDVERLLPYAIAFGVEKEWLASRSSRAAK